MRKLKKITREYFTFTRKERNVGIYLATIILMVILFPSFHKVFYKETAVINYDSLKALLVMIPVENEIIAAEKFPEHQFKENRSQYYNNYSSTPYIKFEKPLQTNFELFPFDPNVLSKEEWLKLGIPESVATRITNYISKGGKFRTSEDLLKTYGFKKEDFDRIKEFIEIDTTLFVQKIYTSKPILFSQGDKIITEINSASLQQLISLGFNENIAARIIQFRDDLGGLNSIDQLKDIYGIDDALLTQVKPFLHLNEMEIRKLNLNTAEFETLIQHAYINDNLAKAIIEYRQTTGKFYSLSEIMKVKGMYPSLFEKLKPYLTL